VTGVSLVDAERRAGDLRATQRQALVPGVVAVRPSARAPAVSGIVTGRAMSSSAETPSSAAAASEIWPVISRKRARQTSQRGAIRP
jgi:hypothetical protein